MLEPGDKARPRETADTALWLLISPMLALTVRSAVACRGRLALGKPSEDPAERTSDELERAHPTH